MSQRRAEPRLWCSDLIQVHLQSAPPAELTANLEEIAPSGACVQFERPVPARTRLWLMLGRHKFPGRVTHCTHNEIGYFAEIRFDAGKIWSRRIYQPKHLLDPRRVAAPGR